MQCVVSISSTSAYLRESYWGRSCCGGLQQLLVLRAASLCKSVGHTSIIPLPGQRSSALKKMLLTQTCCSTYNNQPELAGSSSYWHGSRGQCLGMSNKTILKQLYYFSLLKYFSEWWVAGPTPHPLAIDKAMSSCKAADATLIRSGYFTSPVPAICSIPLSVNWGGARWESRYSSREFSNSWLN